VWVVSGDYKRVSDPTCTPFEPVVCHTFITESTFGLPIYRWPPQEVVFAQINAWWRENQQAGHASILYAYALGKAQRLLAGLDPSIGPIYTDPAIEASNAHYRAEGIPLPPTILLESGRDEADWSEALILAPPGVNSPAWRRPFGPHRTALVSGWMCLRGSSERRAVDRGFVFSDHADWNDLLSAIQETGAGQVLVTHGSVDATVKWLRKEGISAAPLDPRPERAKFDAPEYNVSDLLPAESLQD
jgi:putative mRNA 3-end processing factor